MQIDFQQQRKMLRRQDLTILHGTHLSPFNVQIKLVLLETPRCGGAMAVSQISR